MDSKTIIELCLSGVGLLSSIVAIGISIHFSRKQTKIALYEERIKVYDVCCDFISSIIREDKCNIETLSNFYSQARCSTFLFDKSIEKYVNDLFENGNNLIKAEKASKHDECYAIVSYFSDQVLEINNKFKKFIKV